MQTTDKHINKQIKIEKLMKKKILYNLLKDCKNEKLILMKSPSELNR